MNPFAKYQDQHGLSVRDFAEALGLAVGHTCDLVNGKAVIGIKSAKALSRLTGRAWHKYIPETAA